MKLFNDYQKFQIIFAKDSKNFPKNFFNSSIIYFLLEIFVNFLKDLSITFIRNFKNFQIFSKIFNFLNYF